MGREREEGVGCAAREREKCVGCEAREREEGVGRGGTEREEGVGCEARERGCRVWGEGERETPGRREDSTLPTSLPVKQLCVNTSSQENSLHQFFTLSSMIKS